MSDSNFPRKSFDLMPRVLLVFLLLGAIFRIWLSYSTGGTDVRFWFEDVRVLSSSNLLEFYKYAAYPKPAQYAYPPVWMLILNLVATGYKMGWYTSELSPVFRILVKLPVIVSDILVSVLIFLRSKQCSSDESRALLSAVAWLFNPFVIYVSSMQGMFDSICIFFLLLSVYLLEKDRFFLGGIWFGLAMLTKQYAYLPFLPLILVLLKRGRYRGAIMFSIASSLLFAVFSLPFLVTTPSQYIASITVASRLETSLPTRYQRFDGFFFSGIWYLLDKASHLSSDAFYSYKPALLCSMLLLMVLCYLQGSQETALSDALLGSSMVFTSVGLMINSQYLVMPMAFSAVDIGIHRRNYTWFLPETILATYFPLRNQGYAPIGRNIYGLLVSITMVGWTLTHLGAIYLKSISAALGVLSGGQSNSIIRKDVQQEAADHKLVSPETAGVYLVLSK